MPCLVIQITGPQNPWQRTRNAIAFVNATSISFHLRSFLALSSSTSPNKPCVSWSLVNSAHVSQLHAPNPPPPTNTKPIPTLTRQSGLRRPTHIRNLVLAPPARTRALRLRLARLCLSSRGWCSTRRPVDGSLPSSEQIPYKYERVVPARSQHAAARGVPLDGVEVAGVAAEFHERGARLSDVEDADEVAV